jgi:hypothetical protein
MYYIYISFVTGNCVFFFKIYFFIFLSIYIKCYYHWCVGSKLNMHIEFCDLTTAASHRISFNAIVYHGFLVSEQEESQNKIKIFTIYVWNKINNKLYYVALNRSMCTKLYGGINSLQVQNRLLRRPEDLPRSYILYQRNRNLLSQLIIETMTSF